MNKSITCIAALLMLFSCAVRAQDIQIDWSQQFTGDNKKNGFFEQFMGSNSHFIYAKFNKFTLKPSNKNDAVRIVAFDKTSMKTVAERVICGFGSDKTKSQKYEDLDYFKTIVFENSVFVFWTKTEGKKQLLYVETYDDKLKPIEPLEKIYELKLDEELSKAEKRSGTVNFRLLSNPTLGEKILLVNSEFTSEAEIEVEYKILNNKLKFEKEKKVELPINVKREYDNMYAVSSFFYANDGMLYIETTINQGKKIRFGRGGFKTNSFLSVVQLDHADVMLVDISPDDDNKLVIASGFAVDETGARIYGFYKDLNEEKGYGADGLYTASVSMKKGKMENLKYQPFTKEFLDNLYAEDPETIKASGKKKSKKKQKKEDQSEINWNYEIETVSIENHEILLLCTKENNYSVTTCTQNGGCTTRYYCEKEDVTAFKIDVDGKMLWASNLDRKITYRGTGVPDINVVHNGGEYYVTYGSAYMDGTQKNRKSAKGSEFMKDVFEYATLDDKKGGFEKHTYKVNTVGSSGKDEKFVDAKNIQVVDNTLYINAIKTKLKPSTFLWCLVPCPLAWIYGFNTGNSRKGTGHLGKIEVRK